MVIDPSGSILFAIKYLACYCVFKFQKTSSSEAHIKKNTLAGVSSENFDTLIVLEPGIYVKHFFIRRSLYLR